MVVSLNADGLRALEGQWRELADTSARMPMQEAAWTQSAAEAFGDRGTVTVQVLRREGKLAAVAPLVRRRQHLEILGARELYEPVDLLATDSAALQELCGVLVRRGLPVLLHRVPADSPTIPALRQAVGHRGVTVILPSSGTPMLELDERWATLGGGLSAHRRSDLRRAEHRAASEGGVSVRILRPDAMEVGSLLDEALSVEARGWKGISRTALVYDATRGRFYRAYASRAASEGKLVVAFLEIGGTAAAMQLAVESRDRLWLLKIGYDAAFARLSPGILLLAHVVCDAARRGLHGIEFLGIAEPWLEPWTTEVRQTRLVVAYPLHPRVLPGVALDAMEAVRRPQVRAAAARLALRPVNAVVSRAAARYVAGPAIEDARRIEGMYAAKGFPTIIGFWDVEGDPIDLVVGEYRAAIDALVDRSDAQVSIKVPSLGGRAELVTELIKHAKPSRVGVHIDAMAPGQQDAALDIACRLVARADGLLGCTLTGRWPRSVADAPVVAAAGLKIRVVKSEWPSREDPDHDPRRGFLDVVAALCKVSPLQVQVATHDAPLADRALRMLLEAGVPCEHQVLHGMKAQPAMEVARRLGVPTRVLVAYGTGRVPYSVRAALHDPRAAYRLARDLVRRNRGISLT